MQGNYYPTATTPQRVPRADEMNHLYLSPAQQQQSRPGVFLKRNERIDWRRVGMRIQLIEPTDIFSFQLPSMSNVLHAIWIFKLCKIISNR